jgi:hypothetical protein
MTHASEVTEIYEAMILMAARNDVGSHRWVVHLLSAMIDYSECQELKEVADPLIDAMEKIAPILATTKMRGLPFKPVESSKSGEVYNNVVYLYGK